MEQPAAGVKERARAARPKPAPRPVPVLSEDHAHLSLPDLRSYRTALQAEESKVSYWRRLIQARLELVRAGGTSGGHDTERLRPLLTDQRVGAGRSALVEVLAADDIPPLPDLGELWERSTVTGDGPARARLEADLTVAEEQLSGYRTALDGRLAEATGELIARYRDQPALCLAALPLPRATALGRTNE